jgi:hypothetical protein
MEMPEPKKRLTAKAMCLRKRANTVALTRKQMPDAPQFERPTGSPKYAKLVEQIRTLDAKDQREHGTLFKHFIFTDIRESAHGAKAIASYLKEAGFDFRMGHQAKQVLRNGVLRNTLTGDTVYLPKDPVAGGSDGFAILQSLPLWKNPITVATKRAILDTYNKRPENVHGELLRIIVLDSRFKEGINLFDVKYVHLMEPAIANSDLQQAVGRATRFCGQKGLHFIPRRGWPLEIYTYTTMLPREAPFVGDVSAESVDAHEVVMAHSGLDLSLFHLTKEVIVMAIETAADYALNYNINNFDIEQALLMETEFEDLLSEVHFQRGGRPTLVAIHSPSDLTPDLLQRCARRKSKLFPFTKARMVQVAQRLGLQPPKKAKRSWYCDQLRQNPEYLPSLLSQTSPTSIEGHAGTPQSLASDTSAQGLAGTPNRSIDANDEMIPYVFPSPEPLPSPASPNRNLSTLATLPFREFQDRVRRLFFDYAWDTPIVRNKCHAVVAGKPGVPVRLSNTQAFVSAYLRPESPFKGLLAWHSVGTGKTCMAIAATASFEAAGYRILWVTRNALMSEVYGNIFDSVCHKGIKDLLQQGQTIPADPAARKRLLSGAMLPPMSYRTFQNALQRRNQIGADLYARNRDPLYKTFLVMDEIHKLQDGELGPAEAAEFSKIQKYILDSYRISGAESVRPLLMTATPITNTPKELFEILNTLIPTEEQRLPAFDDFRARYADTRGTVSEEGKTVFQEKAKGLISYLNREFDPTTFAQPEFHTIQVPVGDLPTPSARTVAESCASATPTAECEGLDAQYEADKAALNGPDRRRRLAALTKTYKAQKKACRPPNLDKCYRQAKKQFAETLKKSQVHAMKMCLGPAPPSPFPTKEEFETALTRLRR